MSGLGGAGSHSGASSGCETGALGAALLGAAVVFDLAQLAGLDPLMAEAVGRQLQVAAPCRRRQGRDAAVDVLRHLACELAVAFLVQQQGRVIAPEFSGRA